MDLLLVCCCFLLWSLLPRRFHLVPLQGCSIFCIRCGSYKTHNGKTSVTDSGTNLARAAPHSIALTTIMIDGLAPCT
eukprot:746654-Hanusia_phi.AAC.1